MMINELIKLKPYSFDIEYNNHKCLHQTVEEYYDEEDFLTGDDYKEALETGNVFTGRLYPSNSVGFYKVHGTNYDDVVNVLYKLMVEDK